MNLDYCEENFSSVIIKLSISCSQNFLGFHCYQIHQNHCFMVILLQHLEFLVPCIPRCYHYTLLPLLWYRADHQILLIQYLLGIHVTLIIWKQNYFGLLPSKSWNLGLLMNYLSQMNLDQPKWFQAYFWTIMHHFLLSYWLFSLRIPLFKVFIPWALWPCLSFWFVFRILLFLAKFLFVESILKPLESIAPIIYFRNSNHWFILNELFHFVWITGIMKSIQKFFLQVHAIIPFCHLLSFSHCFSFQAHRFICSNQY